MSTKHLILGETIDFITGNRIPDTHDERVLQEIARFLVNEKGYLKQEIHTRLPLPVRVDGDMGTAVVDFLVRLNDKAVMMILFGPGSMVTRQRPTLAAARLIEDYTIPFAVITNGEDALVMDAISGKIIGQGLDTIFSRKDMLKGFHRLRFQNLEPDRREKEARILFALDILTRRECNDFTCNL